MYPFTAAVCKPRMFAVVPTWMAGNKVRPIHLKLLFLFITICYKHTRRQAQHHFGSQKGIRSLWFEFAWRRPLNTCSVYLSDGGFILSLTQKYMP